MHRHQGLSFSGSASLMALYWPRHVLAEWVRSCWNIRSQSAQIRSCTWWHACSLYCTHSSSHQYHPRIINCMPYKPGIAVQLSCRHQAAEVARSFLHQVPLGGAGVASRMYLDTCIYRAYAFIHLVLLVFTPAIEVCHTHQNYTYYVRM